MKHLLLIALLLPTLAFAAEGDRTMLQAFWDLNCPAFNNQCYQTRELLDQHDRLVPLESATPPIATPPITVSNGVCSSFAANGNTVEWACLEILPLNGTLTLQVTDAPYDDAVSVTVKFVEAQLLRDSGHWISVDISSTPAIDLLALQGTITADLFLNESIPAGNYTEIRLLVDATPMSHTIEFTSGGIVELKIPSGTTSGIKIQGNFTVSETLPALVVVDINLHQSIKKFGPNYVLQPVSRLVYGDNYGLFVGYTDQASLTAATCSDPLVDTFNSAYIYSGSNVIPADINHKSALDVDPFTTTRIAYDAASSSYKYEAAFLPIGNYTIALTCNSNLDDLDKDDGLMFFGTQNITIN